MEWLVSHWFCGIMRLHDAHSGKGAWAYTARLILLAFDLR